MAIDRACPDLYPSKNQGHKVYRYGQPHPGGSSGGSSRPHRPEFSRKEHSIDNRQADRNTIGEDLQQELPWRLHAKRLGNFLIQPGEGIKEFYALLTNPFDMIKILFGSLLSLVKQTRLKNPDISGIDPGYL